MDKCTACMAMNIIKVLGNATCWISRRRCLTLFFMTGVLFFIIDKTILSKKKHWWNNKNISFILNNLNLSFSSYDKPRSVYTLYHVLKTRISDVCSFPPNGLYGHIPLNRSVLNNTILNMIHSYMDDGHYRPQHCTAVQKVAIVIPYRNRQKQLKVFLNNILPRIKRQQLEFVIYVIEQKSGMPFNRGMMSNVGFKEAMSDMEFDCIVFHDVDVLPEDDRNFYICSDNPIHMSVKVEQFGYRLPYEKIAGGIITFSRQQFEEINGFSNQFFGWGGEDDDLYRR
ncbi:beta-1,4-galactosyltransferase 6-like isoform X4 [Mytilus galloprovincialis]